MCQTTIFEPLRHRDTEIAQRELPISVQPLCLCVSVVQKQHSLFIIFGVLFLLLASNRVFSQQSPQQPAVRPEFQTEMDRLASEGWRLKEALEANLEAANRHLAATFQR